MERQNLQKALIKTFSERQQQQKHPFNLFEIKRKGGKKFSTRGRRCCCAGYAMETSRFFVFER
jgi:hypothetical protein